jgi:hypothetical protein
MLINTIKFVKKDSSQAHACGKRTIFALNMLTEFQMPEIVGIYAGRGMRRGWYSDGQGRIRRGVSFKNRRRQLAAPPASSTRQNAVCSIYSMR